MSNPSENLLNTIRSGNALDITKAFQSALAPKIQDRLQDRRVELASQIQSPPPVKNSK